MKFEENVSLAKFSTMRLGGIASYLVHVADKKELLEAIQFAREKDVPILVIGWGSNTIFKGDKYDGLVIINEIKGLEVLEDDGRFILKAGAGETWEDLVEKSVELGLTGIEALTLIPGTVGAAPIQNIGAYGQEVGDVLIELEAYDMKEGDFKILKKEECDFGYRTSIFKSDHPNYKEGRYLISSITLGLKKGSMDLPLYTTLQKFMDEKKMSDHSPSSIRTALLEWRGSYLPDPKKIANCGSFFKNPFVNKEKLEEIIQNNPKIDEHSTKWYWKMPNGQIKISAGRLADVAGLKDWHDKETGMATWKNQALLFINENAKSYSDLAAFKKKYLDRIEKAYGIIFEEEVLTIE